MARRVAAPAAVVEQDVAARVAVAVVVHRVVRADVVVVRAAKVASRAAVVMDAVVAMAAVAVSSRSVNRAIS